jgi:hypothetical protein
MENEVQQWPEGMDGFPEWETIDMLQRVENTPVDRCVHLAEQTWVCYESQTTDTWVDTVTPVLGWWAQYMIGGYTESGWGVRLSEKMEWVFQVATWWF